MLPNDARSFSVRLKRACNQSRDCPDPGKGQQVWIAEQCGVSQTASRKWLLGVSKPRDKYMKTLAKVLNTDLAWLATGENRMMSKSEERAFRDSTTAAVHLLMSIFRFAGFTGIAPEEGDEHDFSVVKDGILTRIVVRTSIKEGADTWRCPVSLDYRKYFNVIVITADIDQYDIIYMDHTGIENYTGDRTDMLMIPVTRNRKGEFATKRHTWQPLRDNEIFR